MIGMPVFSKGTWSARQSLNIGVKIFYCGSIILEDLKYYNWILGVLANTLLCKVFARIKQGIYHIMPFAAHFTLWPAPIPNLR